MTRRTRPWAGAREEDTVTEPAILRRVRADGRELVVRGAVEPAFDRVVDAFVQNHLDDEEFGSAVSVVVDGATVVDVWGGWIDPDRTAEWDRDTIVCMMSVAKGVTAIAFMMLVDR